MLADRVRSRFDPTHSMNQRKAAGTIFLGSGFAAKYRLGGGNFSVSLQWALGLQRLGLDFVWLELLPASKDPAQDRACIETFQAHLAEHGLAENYCLLYQDPASDTHELATMEAYGLTKAQLEARLAGPNTLLNLSYSFHPPFLYRFERRLFCDLDPGEISFWMTRVEMGQSHHHEFWTIGLNHHARIVCCRTTGWIGRRFSRWSTRGSTRWCRVRRKDISPPSVSGTGRTTSR